MNTRQIQILGVNHLKGKSKTSGNDYHMAFAQSVITVTDKEGKPTILVGELILPDNLKNTQPGLYDAEFELTVDREKRITARVSTLAPVKKAA